MPYIKDKEKRHMINKCTDELNKIIRVDGDLNYTVTTLILKVFDVPYTESYEKYERIDGLLEKVKHEIQRRWADPYEDRKMKENGDII